MPDLQFDDHDDDGDEDSPETEIAALIARMDAFTDDLPLEAVLVPFKNDLGMAVGVHLTDLFAQTPGGGAGSAFMDLLCDEAERRGIAVYVKPACPRSKAFYEKFGFSRSDRILGGLDRLPSPPAWVMNP